MRGLLIPTDRDSATLQIGDRDVHLTNLRKIFWKKPKITKGHLIQYYADISRHLLPHLVDRPMVMKRYPNGSKSAFFL